MSEQTKPYVAKNLNDLVAAFVDSLFCHDALLAYCREYEVETNFESTLDDNWPDYTNEVMVELETEIVKRCESDLAVEVCKPFTARITELEAVVEKLDKTADGEYVVPGMSVWANDRRGHTLKYLFVMHTTDQDGWSCGGHGHTLAAYSTRSAAEAATKEGAGA